MEKKLLRITLFISAICILLGGWSLWVEPGLLIINRLNVNIKNWPEDLKGYKIAVIADIHAGSPHINTQKLKKIVDTTNKQNPDVIVLLGDYVIHGVRGGAFMPPKQIIKPLKQLHASDGVIAILGNHDWWYDGQAIWKALNASGITVLENDSKELPLKKPAFIVAGLADLDTRSPDTEKFVASLPKGKPIILLTHSPDVFPNITRKVSLTLAGHTHGGQVRIPFYGSIAVPSKYKDRYSKGLITEQGRQMFVSSGIGTSVLPIRFNCPPEIVLLTINPG